MKSYNIKSALNSSPAANTLASCERGTNTTYAANELNQYTSIVGGPAESEPEFDDDGNQTLIRTATGTWRVTYNGENRPVLWTCLAACDAVATNGETIAMSYDRMGHRVTKNDERFVYDGFLCIKKIDDSTPLHSSPLPIHNYVWDPTEPVATRPLVWNSSTLQPFNPSTDYYIHDGNKNVCEVVGIDGKIDSHYDYAPFGVVFSQYGDCTAINPCRFSSEFTDDKLLLSYYNDRHYNQRAGRWTTRDASKQEENNLYGFVYNHVNALVDALGNVPVASNKNTPNPKVNKAKWLLKANDPYGFSVDIYASGIQEGCELNFIQLFRRKDDCDFSEWTLDARPGNGLPPPNDMYYYDTSDPLQARYYANKDGHVRFYDKPGMATEFYLFVVQRCCERYYGPKSCNCCKHSKAKVLKRIWWETNDEQNEYGVYSQVNDVTASKSSEMDKVLKRLLKNGGSMDRKCEKYIQGHPEKTALVTTIDLDLGY